jgi:hypothetical protein
LKLTTYTCYDFIEVARDQNVETRVTGATLYERESGAWVCRDTYAYDGSLLLGEFVKLRTDTEPKLARGYVWSPAGLLLGVVKYNADGSVYNTYMYLRNGDGDITGLPPLHAWLFDHAHPAVDPP